MTLSKRLTSWRFSRSGTVALMAAFLLLSGAPNAKADGNEFFQSVHTGIKQLVYVGNVRDDRGRLVKGALVNWLAPANDGSGQTLGYGTYTDELGHYRTIDISLVMASRDYTFDPKRIALSVSSPGYKLLRRFRRTPDNQNFGSIEMNFVIVPKNRMATPTLAQRWAAFISSFQVWQPKARSGRT